MNILITGATGFVGKHLIRLLQKKQNYKLFALLRTPSKENMEFLSKYNINAILGDITNKNTCINAGNGMDIIIHMAAFLSDWDPWEKFEKVNITGTKNILESAIENKIKQFIHISTNDVFGFEHKTTIYETEEIAPDNFGYSKSKALAQKEVYKYLKNTSIPYTIHYPLWIFGPEDKTFIPGLIEILDSGIALIIGKKNKLVPLTYVKNLAFYIEKSIMNKKTFNEGFFIGLEEQVTWRQFYKFFEEKMQFKPKYIRLPKWFGMTLAFFVEFIYTILPLKSRPPLTRYVIKNFANEVIYSVKKVRDVLGKAPYDLKKTIDETFDYFNNESLRSASKK